MKQSERRKKKKDMNVGGQNGLEVKMVHVYARIVCFSSLTNDQLRMQ